ncbi:hypothetical protein EDEG_03608 [Edhazardia aedis USNM 41457]|uniref:Uncharacterized protein n=1 Tax=Edhazardia aedis (strain USNM 41457) TaxID=1003232 RepID=J9D246_EDHAE|nr:hypothetical protein EDEG_03608 [Edhazardia aedis USNM 41457]|eukprot:EJW01926.1 hypothetical protein EDEG_03608 [Edhazardia aedis USNM 41457]
MKQVLYIIVCIFASSLINNHSSEKNKFLFLDLITSGSSSENISSEKEDTSSEEVYVCRPYRKKSLFCRENKLNGKHTCSDKIIYYAIYKKTGNNHKNRRKAKNLDEANPNPNQYLPINCLNSESEQNNCKHPTQEAVNKKKENNLPDTSQSISKSNDTIYTEYLAPKKYLNSLNKQKISKINL